MAWSPEEARHVPVVPVCRRLHPQAQQRFPHAPLARFQSAAKEPAGGDYDMLCKDSLLAAAARTARDRNAPTARLEPADGGSLPVVHPGRQQVALQQACQAHPGQGGGKQGDFKYIHAQSLLQIAADFGDAIEAEDGGQPEKPALPQQRLHSPCETVTELRPFKLGGEVRNREAPIAVEQDRPIEPCRLQPAPPVLKIADDLLR